MAARNTGVQLCKNVEESAYGELVANHFRRQPLRTELTSSALGINWNDPDSVNATASCDRNQSGYQQMCLTTWDIVKVCSDGRTDHNVVAKPYHEGHNEHGDADAIHPVLRRTT